MPSGMGMSADGGVPENSLLFLPEPISSFAVFVKIATAKVKPSPVCFF
jgi:hypothetical protein